MSGDVETVSPRPRPLSGGLWTLFSWLRRDEHSSSESLSSAGSDRTVASFAFLAPGHYGTASPTLLPPPPPPTDSYKKRVRDRNVRRQHDRDITLHRKYGLYGFGYDALSLPNARRSAAAPADRADRDRRAASESLRTHVPGKRRAPPPPSVPSTLARRRARKRPAPPPPLDLIKENIDDTVANSGNSDSMNQRPHRDEQLPQNNDSATGCKPEKHSKKDAQAKEAKADIKIRHEKSFLKQIFENRKRNSVIETTPVKLLPNISELDKQAAEMIEKYRLTELTRSDTIDNQLENNDTPGSSKQTEAWICTRCLRKYNSSVITCNYCLPVNKVNDSCKSSKATNNFSQTNIKLAPVRSSSGRVEDKEKLKEMLKEMKDSLPKRQKNEENKAEKPSKTSITTKEDIAYRIVEAPTLRIGSTKCMNVRNAVDQTFSTSDLDTKPSSSQIASQDKIKSTKKELSSMNSVIITQPVVLEHTKLNVFLNKNNGYKENGDKSPINNDQVATKYIPNRIKTEIEQTHDSNPSNMISKTNYDLNTPLKISSLLNPIYVPKTTSTTNTQTPKLLNQKDHATDKIKKTITKSETSANVAQNVLNSSVPSASQTKPITPNLQKIADKNISEPIKKVDIKKYLNEKYVQVKSDNKKCQDGEKRVPVGINLTSGSSPSAGGPSTSNEGRLDQHAKRRELIIQLEQSIAKGDEHSAAEAAVKLAQLRLSCSVLSFSSQIVADALNSSSTAPQHINVSNSSNETKIKKNEATTQKSSQTNIEPTKADCKNQSVDTTSVQKTIERVNIKNAITTDDPFLAKMEVGHETKTSSEIKTSVTPSPTLSEPSSSKGVTKNENDTEDVPILVWVEDKEATRGPVQLHVRRNAVMGDLRTQAEKSLGLAARMQRWIVGKTLCSDDNTPIITLAGLELTAPFYLCLVEADTKDNSRPQVECKVNDDPGNVYNELVKLEKQALVSNAEVFECGVCMEECALGSGVVLRECVHSFCKECLSDVVRHSEEPVVSCPAMGCPCILQEREIKGLVSSDDYEKWLARGLAAAESGTRNAFHCRTRDCTGWALCDPGVRRFPCPVCKRTNCVPCQAIHEGQTCDQHRAMLQESAASPNPSQTDDEGTRALLNTLISRGEALECPECSAIITKKWGCDWVKCSACKTEICWVTKGRRWGPAGRGDTSAGCRCGVDGKRCHPSCGYCH